MNTFKKYFGKVAIIAIMVIIGIYCNYNAYNLMFKPDLVKSGVVLSKNDAMTTGKYPHQYWVISFKYDDKILGTQDINVTYSTFTKLNPGDRTSFKVNNMTYDSYINHHNGWNEFKNFTCMILSVAYDILIIIIIAIFITLILTKFWKGDY